MTAPDADLTPVFIADLGGIWWAETPDAVVLDREWLRENFGPHRSAYGRYEEETMPVEPPAPRRLARDARGRIGEVMPSPIPEHLRSPDVPAQIHLRPVNGGCEWLVPADQITYLGDPQ